MADFIGGAAQREYVGRNEHHVGGGSYQQSTVKFSRREMRFHVREQDAAERIARKVQRVPIGEVARTEDCVNARRPSDTKSKRTNRLLSRALGKWLGVWHDVERECPTVIHIESINGALQVMLVDELEGKHTKIESVLNSRDEVLFCVRSSPHRVLTRNRLVKVTKSRALHFISLSQVMRR